MRLKKTTEGWVLSDLAEGELLPVLEIDPSVLPWLDYWAWKYGYTVFYWPSEQLYTLSNSMEFPNGIRSGLYIVGESGVVSESPRDFKRFHTLTLPEEYKTAKVELPPGQRNFLML